MTPFKAARRALVRKESSLTLQSGLLTGARFIGFAAAFAIPLVLVRVFSQTDFGLYKQVFLIVATAGQVLTLGLPASVFYFVPRDQQDGHRYLVQAVGLVTLTAALGALAILLGAPPIVRWLDATGLLPVIPALAALVLVYVPSTMAHQPPIADRRPYLGGAVMAGSDMLRAAAIIGAALVFRAVTAVVIAATIVAALRLAFLLAYINARHKAASTAPSWSSTREQLVYSWGFWIAILFHVGLRHGHTYYVMAVVPPAAFAIYALGIFQLPIVAHVVESVAEVMIVRASEAHRAGDKEMLRRLWRRATVRLGVLLIPIWAVSQAFALDLFLLLFGPTYISAVPIFRIFLTFFLLRVIIDHGILRATGDTAFLARANVAGLATCLVALPILARWDVMLGAVTAFVLGIAVARFAGLYKVCRRLDLTLPQALKWRVSLRTLAFALVAGLTSFAATRWLGLPAQRLALGGAIFSSIYIALIYAFGPVPRSDLLRLGAWLFRRDTP